MENEFAGLTAIITGAGSGIGLEVAKGLKKRGAEVFGFDINQGEMSSFATFVKCDIGDASSVDAAFVEFKKVSNKLDILVNNAGIGSLTTVEKETDEVQVGYFKYQTEFYDNVRGENFKEVFPELIGMVNAKII